MDQKRLFFAVSLFPFTFFSNTPFNKYRLGKDSGKYTEELISPILSCLADSDSRVSSSLFNTRQITIGTELGTYVLWISRSLLDLDLVLIFRLW